MLTIDRETHDFLTRPLVATIATIGADGAPRIAPIWFKWRPAEDGSGVALLFTRRNTLKWRNIERDPRVALCVDHREVPYRAVMINGTAVEDTETDLFELVSELALGYYGPEEGPEFAEHYRPERLYSPEHPELPNVAVFRIEPRSIVVQGEE